MNSRSRFPQVTDVNEITPEMVTRRFSHRLAGVMGTGRRWSYFGVASRTQIDVRTLKAYAQGTACPSLVKYKRLLAVLGPEIGQEFNIMKGWEPRSAALPPEVVDLSELRRELLQTLSVLEEVIDGDTATTPLARQTIEDADEHVSPGARAGGETLPEFMAPLRVEDIDAEAVARRISFRLRKIVGPDGTWTVADAADAVAIDRRTFQLYLSGEACPNLARYHRLSFVLGPQVGFEMALMIGWEPRHSHPAGLPTAESEALGRALRRALEAVDDLLVAAPSGRLIRRSDRTTMPLVTLMPRPQNLPKSR